MFNNYHKINVYTGWCVWLIASIVYLLTMEPTTSFWDCGEFISSAYKLQVGHPPGAPLYMLFARFFAMWFSPEHVAMAMNGLSALCSSFTILFLFWSITHFAKKAVRTFNDGVLNEGGTIAAMGSGVVGSLAYAFSDSFWFSAAEGEVYAMSSLFTAVVFWAILKWESIGEEEEGGGRGGSLRWLVLIAYLMGLSIGVHLLNLLAIPAIAFVFYFKRYKITPQGLAITGIVSVVVLGFIQSIIIPETVGLASLFEVFFVNSLKWPFNSGVFIYFGIVIALIAALLILSRRKNWPILNLSVLSVMMILIGYSTFAVIYIRSAANPPMDENNPENVFSLKSYLNREQYGSRPLLTGQYWNTPIDFENPYSDKSNNYIKSFSVWEKGKTRSCSDSLKAQYDELSLRYNFDKEEFMKRGMSECNVPLKSYKFAFQAQEYLDNSSRTDLEYVEEYLAHETIDGYNYLKAASGIFPRMHSTTPGDIEAYKQWSDWKGYMSKPDKREKYAKKEAALKKHEEAIQYSIAKVNHYSAQQDRRQLEAAQIEFENLMVELENRANELKPTALENMRFFAEYQVKHMYWRYFMWNFSGKQNDIQGHGELLNGNWLTGIDRIDEYHLGNRDKLTAKMKENRGLNKYYLLPFLLGLIGLVFQLVKNPKDFTVNMILFLLTGLAIVVYLNQDPFQPRERDYAYVGSFYAFAMWIGMSVVAFYYAAVKMTKNEWVISSVSGLALGAVLFGVELGSGNGHFISLCILYMAFLAAILLTVMKFVVREALPTKYRAVLISALLLAVPVLMISENWDDHSRANRRTGVDFATNYLESLAPNALIFTNGDNDTFPLWYAQEVEEIRQDVRVVNLSLLQTDWYADQMKRQAYNGAPVPIGLTEEQYRQGVRDNSTVKENPEYIELSEQFEFFLDDAKFKKERQDPYFKSNRWKLTIDKQDVINKGVVAEKDSALIVDEMKWVKSGRLIKNSMLVYDIIRTNNWERPIYFASTIGADAYNGLSEYFQLEGLAYRLVPIKTEPENLQTGRVATDIMYRNIMEKFKWGNMDDIDKNVYIDENHTRMLSGLRVQFTNLADAFTQEGRPEKAEEVLDKCLEVTPEEIVPYDNMILYVALEYADAGATEKSDTLFNKLFLQTKEKLEYYNSLDAEDLSLLLEEVDLDNQLIGATRGYILNTSKNEEFKAEINKKSQAVDSLLMSMENKLQEAKGRSTKRF